MLDAVTTAAKQSISSAVEARTGMTLCVAQVRILYWRLAPHHARAYAHRRAPFTLPRHPEQTTHERRGQSENRGPGPKKGSREITKLVTTVRGQDLVQGGLYVYCHVYKRVTALRCGSPSVLSLQ